MEKKRVGPKRRFAGFNGEWETNKMEEVASFSKGKGYSKRDIVGSGDQIILYGQLYTNYQVYIKNVETYACRKENSIISQGNEVIIPSSGETAKDIARASVVGRSGIIIGGDLNVIKPSSLLNPLFLALSVSSGNQQKELSKRVQGTSVVHLYNSDIKETVLSFPCLEEQQKIGRFLKHQDEMITLQQRKIDKTKALKSAYLAEMFPAEGERVPKRRFKGFNDKWEIKTFNDLLDKSEGIRRGPFGSALKKEYFVLNSDYVVYEQQNAIYDRYNTRYNITKQKYDELYRFVLSEGDFIMSGAGTIGRISRVPKGIKSGVINQALIRMRINKPSVDSEYFMQWIRSEKMQNRLTQANPASAMVNLVPMSDVKSWEVSVPIIDEQQKIGAFFKQLDDSITNHQLKLDKLKATKQAYLHEIFV